MIILLLMGTFTVFTAGCNKDESTEWVEVNCIRYSIGENQKTHQAYINWEIVKEEKFDVEDLPESEEFSKVFGICYSSINYPETYRRDLTINEQAYYDQAAGYLEKVYLRKTYKFIEIAGVVYNVYNEYTPISYKMCRVYVKFCDDGSLEIKYNDRNNNCQAMHEKIKPTSYEIVYYAQ